MEGRKHFVKITCLEREYIAPEHSASGVSFGYSALHPDGRQLRTATAKW